MDALLKAIAEQVPWGEMPCVIIIVGVVGLFLWHGQRDKTRIARAFKSKDQMVADAYRGKDRRNNGRTE